MTTTQGVAPKESCFLCINMYRIDTCFSAREKCLSFFVSLFLPFNLTSYHSFNLRKKKKCDGAQKDEVNGEAEL